MRRRDFLAGAALTLASPLVARAAFAQNAPARAPTDTKIARLAIFPALGICRVGSSAEFFYAPEVPGLPPLADGRYKDGTEKIKKQAQRFRVYAFNAAGETIREITSAEAKIEWRVRVANTKGAWYGFNNPLDNGESAPGLPGSMRNQAFTDWKTRGEMLVIDSGSHTISGAGINRNGTDPARAMMGRFWKKENVKLAALGTDDAGRLIVFPGDGVARSAIPNNPITNFSDNDGWYDDWCDGPVEARVTLNGQTIDAENAWVASCGPDFAPEIPPFVSLYDVMTDVAIDAGWLPQAKLPVSFRKDIYPIFRRVALMDWVAAAGVLSRQYVDVGNFSDPAFMTRLADPSPTNRALREQVLAAFRDPSKDPTKDPSQQYKLPYMLGDGINYNGSPKRWLHLPDRQYKMLKAWAEGQFVADLDPKGPDERAMPFEQIPLSEQPEALTRAALEPCSGGAFHPGVELTWVLRHKALFRGPYRVRLSEQRDPSLVQDMGLLLTPEKAFRGHDRTPPAVAAQMPGDLTRWMGLPWHCDAFSCQQVLLSNDFPTATWWPALLPIDVLPEVNYNALMDAKLPAGERMKFFASRVAWARGAAGIGYHANASYTDGLNRMIYLWERMGFVVSRPGPTDPNRPKEIPAKVYVEVDRGSMDLTLGSAPFPGIIQPPKP